MAIFGEVVLILLAVLMVAFGLMMQGAGYMSSGQGLSSRQSTVSAGLIIGGLGIAAWRIGAWLS